MVMIMKIYTFFYDKIGLNDLLVKLNPLAKSLIGINAFTLIEDLNSLGKSKHKDVLYINVRYNNMMLNLMKIRKNVLKNEEDLNLISEKLDDICLSFEHYEFEFNDIFFAYSHLFSSCFNFNYNLIVLDEKNKITNQKEVIALNDFSNKNILNIPLGNLDIIKDSYPFLKLGLTIQNYRSFCEERNLPINS